MNKRLEGKVALITGGARGIGRSIADAMAAEGAVVGVLDLREDLAQAAAEEIRATGGQAMAFGGNVAERETFVNAVNAMKQAHGRFDILVNNAIWVRYGPIADITPEMLNRMVGTGFNSVIWGIQVGSEAMGEGGSIINIASAAAFLGVPQAMVYGGIKAGVLGLTRSSAVDLGPRGIRVNAVCPGSVPTEGMKANVDPEKIAVRIARTPLRRLGDVQDIANAAMFLASSESSWVTGTSILVDGGVTHALI
ncbi:MAG: glucose 1-dehydrogenase [Comamonadaceae bacterium]|nr:MAG: glucose 1-dehydrogenase [Comamonadaceae bacterium]